MPSILTSHPLVNFLLTPTWHLQPFLGLLQSGVSVLFSPRPEHPIPLNLPIYILDIPLSSSGTTLKHIFRSTVSLLDHGGLHATHSLRPQSANSWIIRKHGSTPLATGFEYLARVANVSHETTWAPSLCFSWNWCVGVSTQQDLYSSAVHPKRREPADLHRATVVSTELSHTWFTPWDGDSSLPPCHWPNGSMSFYNTNIP